MKWVISALVYVCSLSSGTGHNHIATPQNHNQTSHLYHKYGDLSARAPLTLSSAVIWKVVFRGKTGLERAIFTRSYSFVRKPNTLDLLQCPPLISPIWFTEWPSVVPLLLMMLESLTHKLHLLIGHHVSIWIAMTVDLRGSVNVTTENGRALTASKVLLSISIPKKQSSFF